MNSKKTKRVTISDLAKMIKEDVVDRMATKEDLENLEKKMATKDELEGIKKEIEGVKNQVGGLNKRIDDFAETKVSKIAHKELESRVGFIEKKLEVKAK